VTEKRVISFFAVLTIFLLFFASPGPAWTREKSSAGELKVRADRLQKSGDLSGATKLLREYLEARPGDSAAEAHLADLLSWQGYLTAARIHYEKALRLNPGLAGARRQLNRIYSLSAPWIRTGGSPVGASRHSGPRVSMSSRT